MALILKLQKQIVDQQTKLLNAIPRLRMAEDLSDLLRNAGFNAQAQANLDEMALTVIVFILSPFAPAISAIEHAGFAMVHVGTVDGDSLNLRSFRAEANGLELSVVIQAPSKTTLELVKPCAA
ncbi:MAG TPA: hypothetical protein VGK09_08255 [Rhodocyclaceae bacterium]|jgi:hypothetical protein